MGIYILETPKNDSSGKEYRVNKVIETNIYYDPATLIECFGTSKVFNNVQEAYDEAIKLFEQDIISELGITKISLKKPFPIKE